MSKERKVSKCSDCGGKLHKLGTIGVIRYSRCESCGKENIKKLKKSSLDETVFGSLRECITCNVKYAAAGDPDLCPDCHSSFTGRTAADENVVRVSAPKNCELCDMTGKRVQASYDARTKMGPWAYMCEYHFGKNGVGLGTGSGQKIDVMEIGEQVPVEIPVQRPERFVNPLTEPVTPPPTENPEEQPETQPEEKPQEQPEEKPQEQPEKDPDAPDEDDPLTVPPEWVPKKDPILVPASKSDNKDDIVKNASDNAHPNGELTDLISQQRADTSRWQDGENHSPNPNVDPSSLKGQSEAPAVERISETSVESGPKVERTPDTVLAKVFVGENQDLSGAKVLLQDGEFQVIGNVELEAEDGFVVNWRTGRKSIEKKANYELVIVAAEEQCPYHPGQPKAGCVGCDAIAEQDERDILDDDSEIYYPGEN